MQDQPLYDALLEYAQHVNPVSLLSINDQPDQANRRLYPKLYTIVVDPTVPVFVTAMPPMPQSVRVQQQPHSTLNTNELDESDSQWDELNHSINSIASNGKFAKNPFRRDRHPRQVEDSRIRESLELPPAEIYKQDNLISSQLSTCSFYKNHAPPYMTHSVSWRPRGRVITQLAEHEESVNVMKVSRDNLFVATGSSDTSVKIWSCSKIRSNANIKSEQTYTHQKGEIISLAILNDSHTIASGSREGSIHLFKVDYINKEFTPLLNKFTLDPEEGSIVTMEHFNTYMESLLVFGTHSGNIHGWDIRKKKSSFQLSMEPAMGSITAMVVGPTVHTVVVGTARGFIVVWDLRFEFPVQMWHHYDHSPIVSLTIIDAKTILRMFDCFFVFLFCVLLVLCILCKNQITNKQTNKQIIAPNKNLDHPTKGPLIIISTETSNELCCFDLNSGTCRIRFVMNAAGKQQDGLSAVPTPVSTHSGSIQKPFQSITSKFNGMFGNNSSNKPSARTANHASYPYSSPTTPHGAGAAGASMGLKITQLPSVYPSALGQCPAPSLFSNPSFEASNTYTSAKFGNNFYGLRGNEHYKRMMRKHRSQTQIEESRGVLNSNADKLDSFELESSSHYQNYSSKRDDGGNSGNVGNISTSIDGIGSIGSMGSISKSGAATATTSTTSALLRGTRGNSYLHNCGFIPTVLNKGLNVNDIGNELESLCSNFGRERGGITGCLISKDQFLLSAGRDRVVRYWDLQQPNKSFRISNTQPNIQFRYEAFKDKKYNEIVFQELIEYGLCFVFASILFVVGLV